MSFVSGSCSADSQPFRAGKERARVRESGIEARLENKSAVVCKDVPALERSRVRRLFGYFAYCLARQYLTS